MEVLVPVVVLAITAAAIRTGSGSRVAPWRGPSGGTREQVQAEHLDLYFPPSTDGTDPEDE